MERVCNFPKLVFRVCLLHLSCGARAGTHFNYVLICYDGVLHGWVWHPGFEGIAIFILKFLPLISSSYDQVVRQGWGG